MDAVAKHCRGRQINRAAFGGRLRRTSLADMIASRLSNQSDQFVEWSEQCLPKN